MMLAYTKDFIEPVAASLCWRLKRSRHGLDRAVRDSDAGDEAVAIVGFAPLDGASPAVESVVNSLRSALDMVPGHPGSADQNNDGESENNPLHSALSIT